MLISSAQTFRQSKRGILAASLTLIYLMILLSPLASLGMNSKAVVHVLTGECTGDCNLCGCSPENRASNTCCCSKKRQQLSHAHKHDENKTADCCKRKSVEKKLILTCNCPCGSANQSDLTITEESEVLPFHFREQFSIPRTDTAFINHQHRLSSRHGEPPDPPPKLV